MPVCNIKEITNLKFITEDDRELFNGDPNSLCTSTNVELEKEFLIEPRLTHLNQEFTWTFDCSRVMWYKFRSILFGNKKKFRYKQYQKAIKRYFK